MSVGGYIKLYRKSRANKLWREKRVFSRWEAWEDLLMEAAWEDHEMFIQNKHITIKRGQVPHSERTLADRWSWSQSKVKRFIKRLETDSTATRNATQGISLLTLVNYERYQGDKNETDSVTNQEPTQQRRSNDSATTQTEEDKETKEGKEDKTECAAPSLSEFELYANDKRLLPKWGSLYASLKLAYPKIDIMAEVAKAHAWEVANVSKRKKDRCRFLTNWMGNAKEPEEDGPLFPQPRYTPEQEAMLIANLDYKPDTTVRDELRKRLQGVMGE